MPFPTSNQAGGVPQELLILGDDVENNQVPYINLLLICINIAVFVFTFFSLSSQPFFENWGLVPAQFMADHNLLKIVSCMFIHSGILHIVGNLWALFMFGDNVEERLGHFTYLVFYLACGFFAAIIHVLSEPGSLMPVVGASGAVAGVMGAYMALHPDARCKTWWGDDCFFLSFRTFKVPAVLVIGGWFALQILSCMLVPSGVAHVAFYAHVGGFLSGLALLFCAQNKQYSLEDGRSGTSGTVGVLSLTGIVCLGLLASYLVKTNMTHASNLVSPPIKSPVASSPAPENKQARPAEKVLHPVSHTKNARQTVHPKHLRLSKHST